MQLLAKNLILQTAEGNLDVIQDNMVRIRDLTLQAKNGTYSDEEIKAMQDEVDQRIAEINRVNDSAKYSSLRLFGEKDASKNDTGLALNGATFQVGADSGTSNTILADSSLFASVEFSKLTGAQNFSLARLNKQEVEDSTGTSEDKTRFTKVGDMDAAPTIKDGGDIVSRHELFNNALVVLDEAIDNLSDRKSIIGSAGSRMDSAFQTLTTQYENLSSAKSIITDADIASEASTYTQQQILQQVSTSLLAQANQAPSVALSLI